MALESGNEMEFSVYLSAIDMSVQSDHTTTISYQENKIPLDLHLSTVSRRLWIQTAPAISTGPKY
jgi:hypothetical protein